MVESELINAVTLIASTFEKRRVEYALIGGLAYGLRARPRATKDADFIVNCPALILPALLEDLVLCGFQIDVPKAIQRWQVERFLDFYRGQVQIDWIQPVLPVYNVVLKTAELQLWQNQPIRVATTEGIILTKMLAFRAQDKVDIETMIVADRNQINLDLIRNEWKPYIEVDPERTKWLEALLAS